MMACIQYCTETDTVGLVSKDWCGRPNAHGQVVYAVWPAIGGVIEEHWYTYSLGSDAKPVRYNQLPEAVRLAYMLIQ